MQDEQLEAEPGEPPDGEPVLGHDEVGEHVVAGHEDVGPIGAFAPELAAEFPELLGCEEPRGPDPRLRAAAHPEHRHRPAAGEDRPASSRVAKAGPENRLRGAPERGPDLAPVRLAKSRDKPPDMSRDGGDDPGWFRPMVHGGHLSVLRGSRPVVTPAGTIPSRLPEVTSRAGRGTSRSRDTP